MVLKMNWNHILYISGCQRLVWNSIQVHVRCMFRVHCPFSKDKNRTLFFYVTPNILMRAVQFVMWYVMDIFILFRVEYLWFIIYLYQKCQQMDCKWNYSIFLSWNQPSANFWLQFFDSNKQYLGVVQETDCQVNLLAQGWKLTYS